MIADALGWFIAGICVIAFVTLWFTVCFKELSAKRKSLDSIREQVQMHRRFNVQEHGSENDAAQNILENKYMVYRKVEKDYNALLKRPVNHIPGYIMGFRPAQKGDIDKSG